MLFSASKTVGSGFKSLCPCQKNSDSICYRCFSLQAQDLNSLNAMRMSVAAASWMAANLYFCLQQKCNQVLMSLANKFRKLPILWWFSELLYIFCFVAILYFPYLSLLFLIFCTLLCQTFVPKYEEAPQNGCFS